MATASSQLFMLGVMAMAMARCNAMQSNGLPLPLPLQMGTQPIPWQHCCHCHCRPSQCEHPHCIPLDLFMNEDAIAVAVTQCERALRRYFKHGIKSINMITIRKDYNVTWISPLQCLIVRYYLWDKYAGYFEKLLDIIQIFWTLHEVSKVIQVICMN